MTASMSELGGRIPVLFQYLREELSHGQYVGSPLTPSLNTLLLTRDAVRVSVARHTQEPETGPDIGGPMGPDLGVG